MEQYVGFVLRREDGSTSGVITYGRIQDVIDFEPLVKLVHRFFEGTGTDRIRSIEVDDSFGSVVAGEHFYEQFDRLRQVNEETWDTSWIASEQEAGRLLLSVGHLSTRPFHPDPIVWTYDKR